MLKYLVVLFLFPFGALAADGRPILPDLPFQIVNQEQVGVYHAALRGVFPGRSDKSIAAKISEAQSVLLRRANELLAEVQFRQNLPYRPVRIEWSLVGPNIGEAYPVFIRLNLITALQDPKIFHASVVPHEIAHLLYFQKYGCRKDE